MTKMTSLAVPLLALAVGIMSCAKKRDASEEGSSAVPSRQADAVELSRGVSTVEGAPKWSMKAESEASDAKHEAAGDISVRSDGRQHRPLRHNRARGKVHRRALEPDDITKLFRQARDPKASPESRSQALRALATASLGSGCLNDLEELARRLSADDAKDLDASGLASLADRLAQDAAGKMVGLVVASRATEAEGVAELEKIAGDPRSSAYARMHALKFISRAGTGDQQARAAAQLLDLAATESALEGARRQALLLLNYAGRAWQEPPAKLLRLAAPSEGAQGMVAPVAQGVEYNIHRRRLFEAVRKQRDSGLEFVEKLVSSPKARLILS